MITKLSREQLFLSLTLLRKFKIYPKHLYLNRTKLY